MDRLIKATIAGAALVLSLACGASDQRTTSGQQPQGPTAVAQDRAEPTAVAADRVGPTPVALNRAEPTAAPQRATPSTNSADSADSDHDAKTNPQPGVSAFIEGIGREYPGLLTLPECSAGTQLTLAPLEDDAYEFITPLGFLTAPT